MEHIVTANDMIEYNQLIFKKYDVKSYTELMEKRSGIINPLINQMMKHDMNRIYGASLYKPL